MSGDDRPDSEFERHAAKRSAGLLRETRDFLMQSKKWWLIPVIVSLLLVTALVVLGSTAAAPFIYTLF